MSQATEIDLTVLGRVGVALADETRRRLLVELLRGPAYPADLSEILGLTRSNVSNHLACPRGCGLVEAHAEGRRICYQLADPRLAHALEDLCALVLLRSASASTRSRSDAIVSAACTQRILLQMPIEPEFPSLLEFDRD